MKKQVSYFSYFSFIAEHWGLRLAVFMIYHEVIGRRKYQDNSLAIDDLENELDDNIRIHCSIYQPVSYWVAEQLLNQVEVVDRTAILDAGCGKGRTLAIAAQFGFKHLEGFDLVPYLLQDAQHTLAELREKLSSFTYLLYQSNAETVLIASNIRVIFLFNPFDEVIMRSFISRVKESLLLHPRKLYVLYANPICKQLWLAAGFEEKFNFKRLQYLEGSVLTYEPHC